MLAAAASVEATTSVRTMMLIDMRAIAFWLSEQTIERCEKQDNELFYTTIFATMSYQQSTYVKQL